MRYGKEFALKADHPRSYESQIHSQPQPVSVKLAGAGSDNFGDSHNMAAVISCQLGDSGIVRTYSEPFICQKRSSLTSFDDPPEDPYGEVEDGAAFQSRIGHQSAPNFLSYNQIICRFSSGNIASANYSLHQQRHMLNEGLVSSDMQSGIDYKECRSCKYENASTSPHHPGSGICNQPESKPMTCFRGVFHSSLRDASNAIPRKTRIRWTQELHRLFLECVYLLGGAEKATPRAILKLMDVEGLTIFHVKSHLQKYRIMKCMPEPKEGSRKLEKPVHVNSHSVELKIGKQIKEALQMQLEIQKHLHKQLEVQKELQSRIEEQGRKLKQMLASSMNMNIKQHHEYESAHF